MKERHTETSRVIRVPRVVVTLVPVAATLDSVILRPWMQSDCRRLFELVKDAGTWSLTQDPMIEDETSLSRAMFAAPDWAFTVLHPDRGIVGSFSLFRGTGQYARRAELGGFLMSDLRHCGLGPAVGRALLEFADENGIVRVDARPAKDNLAACRGCELAGMKLEATLKDAVLRGDTMVDECVYSWVKGKN